jgi:hypothetical protein
MDAPGGSGPVGSPITEPQPHDGDKAQAMSQVQMALDLLSQALPGLGAQTPEGEAVLKALQALSKKVGIKAQQHGNLVPAQIEMMKNAAVGGPDVAQLLAMQRGGGQQQPPGPGGPFQ